MPVDRKLWLMLGTTVKAVSGCHSHMTGAAGSGEG
jgi:hypothetical protein